MAAKELEFRGIPLASHIMYFEQLGARMLTEHPPIFFEGSNWQAEIKSETTITFTAKFKVNAVLIRFSADNEETLDQLIKNYLYKTTRVGG